MARLDDLIARVDDPELRSEIERELKPLRNRKQFGLVFEPHEPEFVLTRASRLRAGQRVLLRSEPHGAAWTVEDNATKGEVGLARNGETAQRPVHDLLTVRNLGEEAYPTLQHTGSAGAREAGGAHTVINGENYHALTALSFALAGKVDVIYIDPPFNTGARSWRYNNRFVDANDGYHHSKWLSFMEKRLRLARGLLKPDGVLVVMIDEHESHRLGVLLQDLFRDADHQTVTIMVNPSGIAMEGRFSRVDEYAHIVYFGDSGTLSRPDDMLSSLGYDEKPQSSARSPWESLLRRGAEWTAEARPNLVYPIAVDPASERVIGVGQSAAESGSFAFDRGLTINGAPVAWPIRRDGTLGIWRMGRELLLELMNSGMTRCGRYDKNRGTYAVSYLPQLHREQIAHGLLEATPGKGDPLDPPRPMELRTTGDPLRRVFSMWRRPRHAAGNHGSEVLRRLLGRRRAFDYPKSLYAVRDMLDALTADKPDAMILDFFAGSATTLHAACLLNASDGGRRRTVLVTNNELSERDDRDVRKSGYLPGDAEYESRGVFEAVTRPRIEAALSGRRPDGEPVTGFRYPHIYGLDITPADGFPDERVEFFRLEYMDPEEADAVQHGRLAPLIWLRAGASGPLPEADGDWSIPEGAGCAVLFDAGQLSRFADQVRARPEITQVWIHNDGLDVDRAVVSGMFPSGTVGLLPDDYRLHVARVLNGAHK